MYEIYMPLELMLIYEYLSTIFAGVLQLLMYLLFMFLEI